MKTKIITILIMIATLAARAQEPDSEGAERYHQINGNHVEMWDYYRQSADHFAKIGDTSHLSWATRSMGMAYEQMDLYDNAKELYYKALHLSETIGDNIETGINLHKIANCTTFQFFKATEQSAIDTFKIAKSQFIKAGALLHGAPDASDVYAQNLIGMARCYLKLAELSQRRDFADSSNNCLDKYLREFPNDNDAVRPLQLEMIRIHTDVYLQRYSVALPAITNLLPKFSDGRHPLQKGECYRLMSECYKSLGDYKLAYECSEKHLELVMQSHDDETMKRISNFAVQTELYNARKEHERQQEQMETEQSRQRFFYALMSLAIAAVIAMAVLISVMLYSRRRSNALLKAGNETRAALSEEYTRQLKAVAEVQDIIMDNVEYASIIQSETIGNSEKVKEMFPESFVYYRPRDILSGDWYYSSMVNGHRMIVAADCTGHGIPGAVLSMLGVSALKDIINTLENTDEPVMPGEILDRMRVSVKKALAKNNDTSSAAVDDGMEMTVVVIPPENNMIYFGGANQSALIVRGGKVTRLKGDINSIGNNLREIEHFATITTEIAAGDSVYMFSDGVPDQIGGPEMRKFNIKQLTAFVADNYQLTMQQQKEKISAVMDDWTGDFIQLDDRLFIGLRI